MRRQPIRALVLGLLPVLCLLAAAARAASLSDEQREESVRFVQALQNEDGGFRASAPGGPSQLAATTGSIRALKYLEGEIKDRRTLGLFILSCYDPMSGGFADTPGGPTDVRSTAMGLMAMADLKMPLKERGEKAAAYLSEKAASPADVYIAAAALDAARLKTPKAPLWITRYEASRTPEGTYGSPFETATAMITMTRLGGGITNRDAVLQSLRAAQRPDGGFAGAGAESDLSSSYRMLRAFSMLKEKPDLARLREFVSKCRNADGGYGPTPGQPSTASATYNAAIVLHWADEMEKPAGK